MSVVRTSGCDGAEDWKINVFKNQSFYLDLIKVDLANDLKIILTDHVRAYFVSLQTVENNFHFERPDHASLHVFTDKDFDVQSYKLFYTTESINCRSNKLCCSVNRLAAVIKSWKKGLQVPMSIQQFTDFAVYTSLLKIKNR